MTDTSDRSSVWMQDLTWQDVESYLTAHESPVVLVPIGSTEQHGPHLPLGVDAYQARDLAEGIAETAGVLTTPPIWFGDATHHLGFPGTISLSTDTVVALLTDVYDSLVLHGFENVITINGHRIANLPAIQTATKRALEAHPETHFAIVDLLRIGVQIHERLREGDPEDGMHGGEFETSFMQARHPELVKEEAFVRETHDGFSQFQSNNLVGLDDSVLSPNSRRRPEDGYLGHVGDPTKASPEKGEQIYDAVVENTVTYIDELLASRDT
jgi:creatinine amidohydrolase